MRDRVWHFFLLLWFFGLLWTCLCSSSDMSASHSSPVNTSTLPVVSHACWRVMCSVQMPWRESRHVTAAGKLQAVRSNKIAEVKASSHRMWCKWQTNSSIALQSRVETFMWWVMCCSVTGRTTSYCSLVTDNLCDSGQRKEGRRLVCGSGLVSSLSTNNSLT